MFPTLPPIDTSVLPTQTFVAPAVTEEVAVSSFDLGSTGLVTDEPEVLVWMAMVSERGTAW